MGNGTLDGSIVAAATFSASAVGSLTVQVTASIRGAIGGTLARAQSSVTVSAAPTPGLTLIAGHVGGPGYLDEPVANARLPIPGSKDFNLIADVDGTLWQSDANTCTIRVVRNGMVSTIGTPYDCQIVDSTDPSAVRLNAPAQLALDGAGGVWFVDNGNLGSSSFSASYPLRRAYSDGHVPSFGVNRGSGIPLPDYCFYDASLPSSALSDSDFYFCNGPSGVTSVGTNSVFVTSEGVLPSGSTAPYSLGAAPSLRAFTASGLSGTPEWLFAQIKNTACSGSTPLSATAGSVAAQLGFSQLTSDGAFVYWLASFNSSYSAILKYDPAQQTAQLWPPGSTCAAPFTLGFDVANRAVTAKGFVVTPKGSLFALSPTGNDILAYDASVLVPVTAPNFTTPPNPIVIAGAADPLDSGITQGIGYADGVGVSAKFNPYSNESRTDITRPLALRPVASGEPSELYLADAKNFAIRKIAPLDATRVGSATVSTVFGGPALSGATNGPALQATFKSPSALAVAFDGVVYVADSGNGALRRIAKDGAVTTLFGGSGPALRDGTAAFAALRQVSSMLVLPTHAVLLGDGSTIREYTPETGEVSTVLGSNSTTPAFSDGGPGSASMVGPLAFALAPDGTVAMTDAGANAIRVITSTGEVVTLAASASRNFAGLPTAGNSNAGFESSFFGPRGVAVAADGVVFVAPIPAITRCAHWRSAPLGSPSLRLPAILSAKIAESW